MILFFLFSFFLFGLIFSTLKINIESFYLSNDFKKMKDIKFNVRVKFKLYGLATITNILITEKVIKIFGINLNYNNLFRNSILRKKIKKAGENFKIQKIILLKPNFKSLKFELDIGTESVIITSFLVVMISVILSNGLQMVLSNINTNNFSYKINPNYEEENKIFLDLKTSFVIKSNNIINYLKFI